MKQERSASVFFRTKDLILTNPSLDLDYVDFLVKRLKSGLLIAQSIKPIQVRLELGQGYFVIDGNHHTKAFLDCRIPKIPAEFYTLGKPVTSQSQGLIQQIAA